MLTPRTLAVALSAMSGLLINATSLLAQATTVQLPTFSFFTVITSVLVPDRGGAYMGGVGRASSGRNQFGGGLGRGQTAFGYERRAAGMHVQAHIHDLHGMDEALRNGGKTAAAAPARGPLGGRLAAAQGDQGESLRSLQEIERDRAVAASAQKAEAVDFYRRARDAQAAGKLGVAKTYYQNAQRRATGELRSEIASRLAELGAPAPRLASQ